MQIREYKEADEAAVIALWESCELFVPWNDPHQDIARKLEVDRDLFLIGVLDNRIIASVMGGYDGHRGWINYLAVAPDFQKRGYGRMIMAAVETRLVQKGSPKINLQIRSNNRKVIAFYEALGYKVSDLISMGKRLKDDEPEPAIRSDVQPTEKEIHMRKIIFIALLSLPATPVFSAQFGLGTSISSGYFFDSLYFPIRTEKFIFEPFLSYQDQDGVGGGSTFQEVGLGVFYLIPAADLVSIYAGGRLSSGSTELETVGGDISSDITIITPTVGAEYSPTPNFSIGVEHRIDSVSSEGDGQDDVDVISTGTRIMLRIFL